MKKKDFVSIEDISPKEIFGIIRMAQTLKKELKETGSNAPICKTKTLVMLFEKPSLRTRLSFEIGIAQLGGHAVSLISCDIGMGTRESVADVARVVSGMGHMIVARTFKHATVLELAEYASIPVINGLSDVEHPCQILADLLTIWELKNQWKRLKLAYIGDSHNNVTHSLALASGLLGIHFVTASPKGYWMSPEITERAKQHASISGASITETTDPKEAVYNADIVYTDTWVSMGEETEKDNRLKIFPPYQVTPALMALAKKDALFMHDLPAYRGCEVTSDVIDGPQSVVFQQAKNRLHAQKALLVFFAPFLKKTNR